MRNAYCSLLVLLAFGSLTLSARADLFDKLGLKKSSAAVASLPEDQVIAGLKEALGKGIQTAVTNLGREGGFLNDLQVKIPLPDTLRKVEKTLRSLRQEKLADDFITTMNRAAEQAVPQATRVLLDSVQQMTLADAKAVLTGKDNAATEYFRRTSETNLYSRFLPIVKDATAKTGVTSTYKKMMEKTNLGGFGSALFGRDSLDVDDYVTRKSLDGLFVKIADEEKRIRENPGARTTELLQQVFGSVTKRK